MSNSYTQTCFFLPCSREEADSLLAALNAGPTSDEHADQFGCEFEFREPGGQDSRAVSGLFVVGYEWANIEGLAVFLRQIFAQWQRQQPFWFSWCCYDDKLRPDEQGGGYVLVTADSCRFGFTPEWHCVASAQPAIAGKLDAYFLYLGDPNAPDTPDRLDRQRETLAALIAQLRERPILGEDFAERAISALEGIETLLDEIADQAQDLYGIPAVLGAVNRKRPRYRLYNNES